MAGLFTEQAAVYAAARPAYPKDLFAKLSALTAHHRGAWDVGTGNGQAAIGVSMHLKSLLLSIEQRLQFNLFMFNSHTHTKKISSCLQ